MKAIIYKSVAHELESIEASGGSDVGEQPECSKVIVQTAFGRFEIRELDNSLSIASDTWPIKIGIMAANSITIITR